MGYSSITQTTADSTDHAKGSERTSWIYLQLSTKVVEQGEVGVKEDKLAL